MALIYTLSMHKYRLVPSKTHHLQDHQHLHQRLYQLHHRDYHLIFSPSKRSRRFLRLNNHCHHHHQHHARPPIICSAVHGTRFVLSSRASRRVRELQAIQATRGWPVQRQQRWHLQRR